MNAPFFLGFAFGCIVSPLVVWFLSISIKPSVRKIKNLYYSRYWSKPFSVENPIDYRLIGKAYRYNTKTFKLQRYDNGIWEGASWVYGDPFNITCNMESFQFNPYDWFENPLKPTLDEVTLWELEFGFEFKKIKKEVIKICKGGN